MSDSGSKSDFLEGYEKLRTVGKGAFGTATLYKRTKDNMHVVMKEVFLADMTREEQKMALNEVDVLARLKHPNIIRYMGSFERDGSLVIIMEYANGGNLAQLISHKRTQNAVFSEKSVLQIVYQISGALSYMHNNKILHRDLKAANIFLNSNGAIKVGDFGISKILNTKSQAETIIGTPYYLSPEMCEGKDYNEKSDIWALGCILYELLSLRRPFQASTLPLLVQKITKCQYEDIPPIYSEGLHHLVHLILQRNCDLRPSAKDIHSLIIPGISRNSEILNDINILLANSSLETYGYERSLLYRMSLSNGISSPVPFELPNKKFINIACSKNHYIAVAEDYSVYSWGNDTFGQLGQGKLGALRKHPICVDYLQGKNIEKCVAGNKFSIFLAKSGLLLSCGDGKNGCLGHGDWNGTLRPKLIDSLITSVITDVVCGSDHVLALTVDRRLFVWGLGDSGQLGLEEKKFCCFPVLVKIENFAIDKIFAGENASAILSTSGEVMVCGSNKFNKLGIPDLDKLTKFTPSKSVNEKISYVALGVNHTILLTSEGNLIAMGRNSEGQLGKENCKAYSTPQRISLFNREIKMVRCGPTFTIAASKTNVLYFWGTHYTSSSEESNAVTPKDYIMECLTSDLEQPVSRKEEKVLKPKSVLALYSSPDNERNNNYLKIGDISCQEYGIILLVHTTTHPPRNNINSDDNINNNNNRIKATPKNINVSSNDNTSLPNSLNFN